MYPKTPYGWYNKIIRRYPYNEKTRYILDHTFNPSPRLLTAIDKSLSENWVVKNKKYKATMANVRSLLSQHKQGKENLGVRSCHQS
jgi:hypothetical protein